MSKRQNQNQKKNEKRKAVNRQKQLQTLQMKKNFIGPLPRMRAAPAAQSRSFQQSAPSIRQTNPKSCRIHHREFVDTIFFARTPQVPFNPIKYPLNAGWDETFSWLSNIAINWERYKFHKLRFHFLTRSPTSTKGSILAAIDFDAADSPPIDELTMMSYEGAREDAVWKDLVIDVNINSLMGGRRDHFVRSGILGQNLDIKTYDVGNFYITTDIIDDTLLTPTVAGKLFVEYDVEFFTPQLPPTGDPLVGGVQAVQGGGGSDPQTPFGVAPVNGAQNLLGKLILDPVSALNSVQLVQAVPNALLNIDLGGTGITALPNISFAGPNGALSKATKTTWLSQVINAASTRGNITYSIKDLAEGDWIHVGGSSATTINGGNFMLNAVQSVIYG